MPSSSTLPSCSRSRNACSRWKARISSSSASRAPAARSSHTAKRFVQHGPARLRQRRIGSLAHQCVAEAEGFAAAELWCGRAEEVLAHRARRAPPSARRAPSEARAPSASAWKSHPRRRRTRGRAARARAGARAGRRAAPPPSAAATTRHLRRAGGLPRPAASELFEKSGWPPAVSTTATACPAPARRPPGRRSSRSALSRSASGASEMVVAFALPPPRPAAPRAAPAARRRRAGSARRVSGPRTPRAGRARSARRSEGRRRRRQADARRRSPRAGVASPRRSRPPGLIAEPEQAGEPVGDRLAFSGPGTRAAAPSRTSAVVVADARRLRTISTTGQYVIPSP